MTDYEYDMLYRELENIEKSPPRMGDARLTDAARRF